MSSNSNDTFSSPRSPSRSPERGMGINTPSSAAHITPATPPPPKQHRFSLFKPYVPADPNDIRRHLAGEDRRANLPNDASEAVRLEMDARIKSIRDKFGEQERIYLDTIQHHANVNLQLKETHAKETAGLGADIEGLWATNQELLTHLEAFKVENRKLKHDNASQKREIDQIRQECMNNGAAIQSIAVDQQNEFDLKIGEVKEQLKATQEENGELYDKCMALEQENDDLKISNHSSDQAVSARLRLINLAKDRELEKEELVAIKMSLNKLNDDLSTRIEYRMLREGTMLFDLDETTSYLDEQQFKVEEANAIIKRQEHQIEALQETIERQETQIEELVSQRGRAGVLDLEAELDAAEISSPTESSVDETEMSHQGEFEKQESAKHTEQNSDQPRSVFGSFFKNLFDGHENDEDLMWPSSSKQRPKKANELSNNQQIEVNFVNGSSSSLRTWTEMISLGRTYWIKVADKDCTKWIRISGPRWWSLIIQLLSLMLIWSLLVAYWCIMKASAERELWLDANEITMRKYWDTAVWGVERGILWRLHYGLGLV